MEFRELAIIVLVAAAGCGFIWYETGRDPLLLRTMATLVGIFAVGGAVATVLV